jgi:hypothetical protein
MVYENGEAAPNTFRPKFLQPPLVSTTSSSQQQGDLQKQREGTLAKWYQILNQFTLCSLSNPHDIFAAFAAIAQLASRVLHSRYLAGLWECDIVHGLLWRPCYHFQVGSSSEIPVTRPTRLNSPGNPDPLFGPLRGPGQPWRVPWRRRDIVRAKSRSTNIRRIPRFDQNIQAQIDGHLIAGAALRLCICRNVSCSSWDM